MRVIPAVAAVPAVEPAVIAWPKADAKSYGRRPPPPPQPLAFRKEMAINTCTPTAPPPPYHSRVVGRAVPCAVCLAALAARAAFAALVGAGLV